MRLRRFAAVVHKPLKLHMRRLAAAVLRWFAAVPKTQQSQGAAVLRRLRCYSPHTPIGAPRRLLGAPRAPEQGDGAS